MDNVPKDFSEAGYTSRKILSQSVNYRPRQVEKACEELESGGLARLHAGFFSKFWSSISITDDEMDVIEPEEDWELYPTQSYNTDPKPRNQPLPMMMKNTPPP